MSPEKKSTEKKTQQLQSSIFKEKTQQKQKPNKKENIRET